MEAKIANMEISDLESIKLSLKSEFDDFWNYDILKGELISDDTKYIVAKIDDKIVGFAGIKIVLDEADIMNIVVKKNCRNHGIGHLLLKFLISICKDLDVNILSLEVSENNFSAIKLYKDFGFEEIGIRKKYYKNKNAKIFRLKIR